MGRPLKVSRRTRSILRALNAAPAKSSEQKKLEKEQARQARLKLKAEEKAARDEAKRPKGPAQMVVQVQAPAKPEYIATVDRTTGTITRTPLPTAPQTAPEPEAPAPANANPNMPIWVQEGRSATRAEWEAHQAARCNNVRPDGIGRARVEQAGPTTWRELDYLGNGAGEHVAGNGVRGGSRASTYWNGSLKDL